MSMSVRGIHSAHAPAPYLIVDRANLLGVDLFNHLKQKGTVVLVGSVQPKELQNLVYIPFTHAIPRIPDTIYSGIYFIWDGNKDILDVLPQFMHKAHLDGAPFILLSTFTDYKKEISEKLFSEHDKTHIFILGDMFGKDLDADMKTEIDTYLADAKKTGSIKIAGMGLEKLYPIGIQEVIQKIDQELVIGTVSTEPTYLFSRISATRLSLLHTLQKIDPGLRIDFTSHEKKVRERVIPEGKFAFDSTYSYIPALLAAYKNINGDNSYRTRRLSTVEVKGKKGKKRKTPAQNFFTVVSLFLLYTILVFLAFPIICTSLFSFLGSVSLSSVQGYMSKGDISDALVSSQFSHIMYSNASFFSAFLIPEVTTVGRKHDVVGLMENIDSGKIISQTITSTLISIVDYKKVVTGTSAFPSRDFLDATNALQNTIVDFQTLRESSSLPLVYARTIQKLSPSVELIASIVNIFPQLFGIDKPRTYLVLFQDNTELRPEGGFIDAYGVLQVANGRVLNFHIQSINAADSLLKGHIEPAYALRRYLPADHLYLKDSNFDVDFSKGASVSANILHAETGQLADGVITVDLTFIKSLLSSIGPVTVQDFHQIATDKNVLSLVVSHSSKRTPAAGMKKDNFILSLLLAIQSKMLHSNDFFSPSLLETTTTSLREKHILFASQDSAIQNTLTVNGLSSGLWASGDPIGDIEDFVGINEANLGMNKANFFVTRSINQHVRVDDYGNVQSDIELHYKNNSNENAWPAGDYKNYLRFIVPTGSLLTTVAIDGNEQKLSDAVIDPQLYEKKGFVPPTGLEVEHYEENGRTIFGFLVTIPADKSSVVKVSYALPEQMDMASSIQKYTSTIFKQPGTDVDPFAFSLDYPSSLRVLNASAGMNNGGNSISYVNYLNTDKNFEIDFAKK